MFVVEKRINDVLPLCPFYARACEGQGSPVFQFSPAHDRAGDRVVLAGKQMAIQVRTSAGSPAPDLRLWCYYDNVPSNPRQVNVWMNVIVTFSPRSLRFSLACRCCQLFPLTLAGNPGKSAPAPVDFGCVMSRPAQGLNHMKLALLVRV